MSALTTNAANAFLDFLFRVQALTPLSSVYLSLHSGNPSETGALNEFSAPSYARKQETAGFDVAANGTTQNTGASAFGTPAEDWGTATHFAIFDALTGGNPWLYGLLADSKDFDASNVGEFGAGELDLTISAGFTTYLANLVLDYILRGTSPSAPASVWMAAHDGDPTATGEANELTAASYARKQLTSAMDVAANSTTSNTADVEFVQAAEPWGNVVYVSFWDAASGGKSLLYGALADPQNIGSGDTLRFLAGVMGITLN